MNQNKLAAVDADRWARAEMFFGEGAGTRRKLLKAEIANKASIPGYGKAFHDAYEKQDWAKHAIQASKERQHLDRSKAVKRNVRGLVTGNRQSLTTGLAVAVTLWVFAKQTGLDEPIKREVKKGYGRVKIEYLVVQARFKNRRHLRVV